MCLAVYVVASSASTFFLTLDRCLALRFAFRYDSIIRRYFTPLSIIILIALTLICVGSIVFEIPLDLDKVQLCQGFNCVCTKYRNINVAYLKLLFALLNTILMFYLLSTLRAIPSIKQNDRLVKVAIILEVVLNGIPTLCSYVFIFMTGQAPANYVGEFSVLLFTLSIAVCSMYYSNILLRKPNKSILVRNADLSQVRTVNASSPSVR
ncbi:hypothetical protein DdX_05257 [Ditylenchus destructor]|uniref:Uncharacterized protein n=1 Tax=Ditylenchus destructor TaxID=166010 RepID=A0AAD4NDZ1_9BILA|nr:hypothetical protein DdX_05257 [Ditylenchus destructor]